MTTTEGSPRQGRDEAETGDDATAGTVTWCAVCWTPPVVFTLARLRVGGVEVSGLVGFCAEHRDTVKVTTPLCSHQPGRRLRTARWWVSPAYRRSVSAHARGHRRQ